VGAIALATNGAYPRGLFDYVIGLNRWVIRVVAYGALMTSDYPPFLLDKGEHEPTGRESGSVDPLMPDVPTPGEGRFVP
jgi:hypothetical protein